MGADGVWVPNGEGSRSFAGGDIVRVLECRVVQAHFIGSDAEANHWLLNAAEWSEMIAGPPDVWDGFVRSIGGEVRVSRHFRDGERTFWDAMRAALDTLGVVGVGYGLMPGPVWHSNDRLGFYTYVKELEVQGEG